MAKVSVVCANPSCTARSSVDEALLGKKAKCKHCGTTFVLARTDATPPPAAASGQRPHGDDGIPLTWEPGDVVLDLYEVRPFDEKTAWIEGGMGRVNCVWHRGWNRLLAVKSVRPAMLERRSAVENFQREAEVWVDQLGLHPNVVSCHYVRVLAGLPRLFMDLVPGGSLQDWIDTGKLYEGGPDAALERILDIAIQFAWGLHHAHEQGLIHQDVKPANLLMTSEGIAKVTDFGLAKARAEAGEQGEKPAGEMLLATWGGMTPAYCSPEQAEIAAQRQHGLPRESSAKLTRGTDIWSWAATVLVMFTGEVVWESGSAAGEYLSQGVEDAQVPIPAVLVELLELCFQQRAADRPRDLAKVADALRSIYAQVTERLFAREQPRPGESLADSLNNRAASLLDLDRQKNQAAAERLWAEALGCESQHPEASYNLGLLQWRSARITDESLALKLQATVTALPGQWRPAYLLALVHLERDDCAEAIKLLEAIQEADAERSEVRAALATARQRLPRSRRLLQSFTGPGFQILAARLDADGRHALLGCWDGVMRLWELATGQCLQSFHGHQDGVLAVHLSPDGAFALSGSSDATLKWWEVATGRCLQTLQGHQGRVQAVCLSPDGRFALSGGADRTLKWWELASGQCLRTFQGHWDEVNSVCLSLDGRFALSASGDSRPRYWEIATGQCLQEYEFHQGKVTGACLSPDGRHALSASSDRTLMWWELASGDCVRTLLGHGGFTSGSVTSVSLSADGRLALSGGWDHTVRLWEVATGRCLRTFGGPMFIVGSVCISADDWLALATLKDGTCRLWNIACHDAPAPVHYQLNRPAESGGAAQVAYQEALSAAEEALRVGDAVAAAAQIRAARSQPGYSRHPAAMRLWCSLYPRLRRRALAGAWETATLTEHVDAIGAAALSVDGRYAASASSDETLKWWDVATGQCLRSYRSDRLRALSMSPDGRHVLAAFRDKLEWMELATGQLIRISSGHATSTTSVCLDAEGRFALSGCEDSTVNLWELPEGRCLRTFSGHGANVISVYLSADGCHALSGSDDATVKLWELETGRCLRTFQRQDLETQKPMHSVGLTADGRFVFCASWGDLLSWEVATGQCVRVVLKAGSPVCWGGDGRYALACCADNSLKLWDLVTGSCLHTFLGHADQWTSEVSTVCLSADLSHALSGGRDRTLKVWVLDWELEDDRQELKKVAAVWTGPPPLA